MTATPPYILYGLTGTAGSDQNKGPHAFKTEVDLAILGVPFQSVPYTFSQVRNELAAASGNPEVTVPTLQAGDEYVTDSWAIAEWLEARHAAPGRTLFASPEGKAFAKFLEHWVNTDLADELRPLVGPTGFAASSADAQAWYVAHKLGGDDTAIRAAVARANDPDFIEAQAAAARARLQTLETHLAYLESEGHGPFLAAGARPSHADALVFGWYASSQAHKVAGPKIWRSDELPLVGAWVDAVIRETGVDPQF